MDTRDLDRRRLLASLPLAAAALAAAGPALAQEATGGAGFSVTAPGALAALDARIRAEGVNHWRRSADEATARTPRPARRVHVEGGLPGQPDHDQGMEAKRDWPVFLLLGVAWRGMRDPRHLEAYQRFLRAWLTIYEVSGNPIDEEGFDLVMLTFDLTKADLPAADRALIERFLVRVADTYLDFLERTRRDTLWSVVNNFSSHRVKLATLAAHALGDPVRMRRAADAFVLQVGRNVRKDGHTMDFEHRDAIHYHLYSTLPLVMAVASARAQDADWFDVRPDGAGSVRDAVDWLMPYVGGTKTHEEFRNTAAAFDRIRGDVGVPGFRGLFDPVKAVDLMTVLSHLDPAYRPVRDRLFARVTRAEWRALRMIFPPAA